MASYFKRNKKDEPKAAEEAPAEEKVVEKIPFNPIPIISIVGCLVVVIALFGQANGADIALVIFVAIAAIFIGWGIWYNSNRAMAKYWKLELFATVLLVIGGIIMSLVQKGFDFVTYDQTWISPSIFFFLGLLPAFIRKRFGNMNPSFWWFVIPNLLSFGVMAATVTKNGSWLLYAIAIYITVVICMIGLKSLSVVERLTRLTFPSLAYTTVQVLAMIIAIDMLLKIVDKSIFLNIWWCYVAIISGCLIGEWITNSIRRNILNLP